MPRVALMQPYFFPYLGYFQLIASSDVFVLYDDAQYIRSGWSNRNRIQRDGAPHFLTFPVRKADYKLSYAEREYQGDPDSRSRVLRAVEEAYKRAPFFAPVMTLIEDVMAFPDANVAAFNRNLIEHTCNYIGIPAPIVASSELALPPDLRGQERVISICTLLSADQYVNSIGGEQLYDRSRFSEVGIELFFLRPRLTPYPQGNAEPIPNLSVIDALMYNSAEAIRRMLSDYELV